MKRVRFAIGLLAILFVPNLVHAVPYGDPFLANVYTVGEQRIKAVATGTNGDSALLWYDGGRPGWFLQRYDAAGRRLQAEEWYVGQNVQDVAVSGTGSFAVLSSQSDGSGSGVYVTVYNRSGTVIVPQFRVNNTTAGEQIPVAIAMNANGQFAVMWWQGTTGVYVKRFNANGTAVAPEQVASNSSGIGGGSDIAIDGQGNFVATWTHMVGNEFHVFARRFSASGYALAPAFRVHGYAAGIRANCRIAMNATGSFVIVWNSYGQVPGQNWLVFGQRFNSSGNAVGGEFQVSQEGSESDGNLAIGIASNGNFMVTWHDDNRPTMLPRVWARSYRSDGVAFGAPFAVATNTTRYNWIPHMGMDPDGNAIIAWAERIPGTTEEDVYARRYSPEGVVIQSLGNGQALTGLSGAGGSWQYFRVTVPAGHNTVDISIWGSVGDADLYVRQGALPTYSRYDARPWLNGSNESVRMVGFPPGDWYIGINGYSAYSALSLYAVSY